MAKREKRVALITDTAQHIGPYVARKLAAALLDGGCNYYTAQFLSMSGGWNGI
jgi:hypothetical protein